MPKSIYPREPGLRVTPVNSKRIEVTFVLEFPEAQEVFLAVYPNDCSPVRLRMVCHNRYGRRKNTARCRRSLQMQTNPPSSRIRFITLTPTGMRRMPAAGLVPCRSPQDRAKNQSNTQNAPKGDSVRSRESSGTRTNRGNHDNAYDL